VRNTLHWLKPLAAYLVFLGIFFLASRDAEADQNYSQQVIFENSLSPGNYFYSRGKASAPSSLRLVDGKLPIDTSTYVSGPNALRLEWQSMPNGGWEAELHVYEWRDRFIDFPGDTLFLWLYAKDGIAAGDLPEIVLRDRNRGFTAPLALAHYSQNLSAGKWTRIRIPLRDFLTASVHPFESRRLTAAAFLQGAADATPHTLLIDDIRIENLADQATRPPPAPQGIQVIGYERHFDITWQPVADAALAQYVIYRSQDGGAFRAIGVQRAGVNRFSDFVGNPHITAAFKVSARTSSLQESPLSAAVAASTHSMTDDELLTMVQQASFRYYWEAAEPHSGMTRENTPGNDDIVAVGASGFGIMATIVAADRGFITRPQAVDRLLQETAFLEKADRFHGVWPHFLSGATGHVLPLFGMVDNGADLVETSFMMEGLLSARQYFQGNTPAEQELRARISDLWQAVDWNWFRATPKKDALYWHWSPDFSFFIANRLTGWNEVMITYLLAIASPTHAVPASLYNTGWVGKGIDNKYANGTRHFGITLAVGSGTGGPLFFTDYSFMGFDPHHRHDQFTDYFENNRNQALINQAYCIANPHRWKGYGADSWGLTAVDGPDGYSPYEPTPDLDDGTIAPTGAISALAYTPEQSRIALIHFYRDLGARVWDIYGFRDSFNQQQNWYSGITMGLNQAPMVVMIENYRTGLVWLSFMANPEIADMLVRAGFQSGGP
jgi:hypothetical protein